MNRPTLVLIGALTLSSCSLLTGLAKDALTDEGGIDVDAQVGSNEAKVNTGVGKLDFADKTTIEDNEGDVRVRNSDGKYHIESTEAVNVVVQETNELVYYLMGFFFIITLVREFLNRRRKPDDAK